jgi:hypothetical protein
MDNDIKIVASDKHRNTFKIRNNDDMIEIINNEQICMLDLYEHPNNLSGKIDYIKLFELLKTNKSIRIINFTNYESITTDIDYTEWYTLLCDTLTVNNSVDTLGIPIIGHKGWHQVDQVLKTSNITHFMFSSFDTSTESNNSMTNILKNNSTLLNLTDNTYIIDSEYCKCLADILSTNNTITSVFLSAFELDGLTYITDVLEHNYSIQNLYTADLVYVEDEQRIEKYCKRNKHNYKLKSMMLCDL